MPAGRRSRGWASACCCCVVPLFCAVLNVAIDRVVYKPLRSAPKLAPLVSAIGVSFVLMNVGLLWGGAGRPAFSGSGLAAQPAGRRRRPCSFTAKDLMVIADHGADHDRADAVREMHAAGQGDAGHGPGSRWPRS